MGFVLTVIAIMLTLDGLWAWLSDRFLRGVRGARGWRLANAAFIALQAIVLLWVVGGRLLDLHAAPPTILFAAALIWHLIVLPVAVVLGAFIGVPMALAVSAKSPPQPGTSRDVVERFAEPVAPPVTRRSFLRAATVMTPPLVTTLATGVSMPQLAHFRVRRLALDLPTLPPALDGMTIAHVSDVHVGRFTRGPVLDRIVAATNALSADLVLLTGDLINDTLDYLDDALALVQRFNSGRGLAMCEGNHDLIESRAEFEGRTRASGVPLLINEDMIVRVRNEPIQLLGLRWGRAAPGGTRRENNSDAAIASSMNVMLRSLSAGAFPILLAHHPHAFDPAAAAGIPLTLAGHTHGGQLMLTDSIGFGPQMFRYWSGAYRKPDGALLIVSNGVGNWFPLRVNAPAEIVHLTLRRGTGG